MNHYRVIGQIAALFGIVFIIFAAFAAIVSYEGITAQYGAGVVPLSIIEVNIMSSMIPYLLYAALSFAVSGVITRASRDEAGEQTKPEPLPAPEPDMQAEENPTP